jgi:hypothetical protein
MALTTFVSSKAIVIGVARSVAQFVFRAMLQNLRDEP